MQQGLSGGNAGAGARRLAAAAPLAAGSLIAGLAALQVAFSQALYGDGAFVVLMVLEQGGNWFIVDRARLHADWLNQAPLVWAAKAGMRDTHALARIYTLGQVALPMLCCFIALGYARRNALLLGGMLLAIAFALLNAGFVSHGEYVWAYALAIAMAAILLGAEPMTLRDAALLVVLGMVAVRSYEAYVFLGPLLAGLAIARLVLDEPRPGPPVALLLGGSAFLSAAATAVSAWAILHPRDPSNLAGARNFAILLENPQLQLTAIVAAALLAGVAAERIRGAAVAALAVTGAAAIAFLLWRGLWALPLQHYLSRVVAGFALFALLFAIAALKLAPRRGALKRLAAWDASRPLFVAGALAWLAALSVPFAAHAWGWRDFLVQFHREVNARTGVVAAEATALAAPAMRPYGWWWTNPSLSLLLRSGPAHAVVRNNASYGGWEPFDPAGQRPALRGYSWR